MPFGFDEDEDSSKPEISEDSGKPEESTRPVFLPSCLEQAAEILEETTITGEPKDEKKKLPDVEFTREDVLDAVEPFFDLAAIVTKYKGYELTPEEKDKLGRRLLRPFQRRFSSSEGMDLYLAFTAIGVMVTDKVLGHMEVKEQLQKEKKVGLK